jgi:hypothetical protein
MYKALTPQWAGTLLGLVQVALIPIPFVFYKWGDKIRAKSPLIKRLRDDQERAQKRAAKVKRKQDKDNARGVVTMNGDADVEREAAEKTTVAMPVAAGKD